MTKPTGRVAQAKDVPHNLEAERAVLGAMFLNNDAIPVALDIIGADWEGAFFARQHQVVYKAMIDIFMSNMPFDIVTLMYTLEAEGLLADAGGASYLAELTRAVPMSANVEQYARIVSESHARRRIHETASRLAVEARSGGKAVSELLDSLESDLGAISNETQVGKVFLADHAAKSLYTDMAEMVESGRSMQGTSTGIKKLDSILCGLQPSDMIVVAARPSVGKTAFSLSIMRHTAIELGVPTLMFSLEMSVRQLMTRHAMATDGLIPDRFRHNWQAKAEVSKLERFSKRWEGAPCEIFDQPGLNVVTMRTAAKRFAQKHKGKTGVIILDYLQLMSGDSKKRREEQVSEISRRLKALARELDWPVIALSQLNRDGDDGEPKLSQLRESGAIEQDADVVMMMWRPKQEEGERWVKLSVKKQRNGPLGDVLLWFDGQTQTFQESALEADKHKERLFEMNRERVDLPHIEDDYQEDDLAF